MNDLFIKERTSLLPKFIGNWDKLGFVVGLTTTLYFMYVGAFGTFSPALDRSIFIFAGVALAICYFPLANSLYARILDVILFLAVSVATYRFNDLSGGPGRIRTCDQLIKSQLLYRAELRAQILFLCGGEQYVARDNGSIVTFKLYLFRKFFLQQSINTGRNKLFYITI